MTGYRKFDTTIFKNCALAPPLAPPNAPKVDVDPIRSRISLGDLGALGEASPQSRFLTPSALGADWEPQDWRAYYDERAGIAEFCGGLSRDDADVQAFACCIAEWQKRHPAPARLGLCSLCGNGELTGRVGLEFGTDDGYCTWLHRDCWPAWSRHRRQTAIDALVALGIIRPTAQSRW